MPRLALRLLLLSLLLCAVGFASNVSAWFEVLRVAGGSLLAIALVLLLINHARGPDVPEN